MSLTSLILLLAVLFPLALAANTTCSYYGDDCYDCAGLEWSIATVSIINDSNPAFLSNFKGLMSTDIDYPHMTVQYLCCFSLDAYAHLGELFLSMQWEPIPITYGLVGCNYRKLEVSLTLFQDDPEHLSYIVWLDEESQARMFAFVDRIEAAMEAAGYPVPRPRSTQEPFHTTIGVVNPAECPAAELLSALNGNITVFSPQPVIIESFDLAIPPVHVVAHNDTTRGNLIASLPRQRFYAQRK